MRVTPPALYLLCIPRDKSII
uniref:Uncharacterized protein n=1 Tax=Anguilla anguilla TaxID=7936 RepID=A0A0E9VMQ9_ANGAN